MERKNVLANQLNNFLETVVSCFFCHFEKQKTNKPCFHSDALAPPTTSLVCISSSHFTSHLHPARCVALQLNRTVIIYTVYDRPPTTVLHNQAQEIQVRLLPALPIPHPLYIDLVAPCMHAYSPSQMSVNIISTMVPIIYLVLIGAWIADAQNLGNVSRWLSSTMDVLRERREVMEKGGATELDPRLVAAEKKPRVITVRQDGTGDFRRLTEAVDSVPPGNLRRTIIRIGKGVYREKLVVPREKRYITFYGESAEEADMPVISYNGIAAEYNGTIFSATVAVESNHFMAVNMIFEVRIYIYSYYIINESQKLHNIGVLRLKNSPKSDSNSTCYIVK